MRHAETTTTEPGGRIVAYDALRVLAIVTVVAIHTLMPYRSILPPTAPVRVFDDLLHYAVPLFVFISGALLWSRRWHPESGVYRRFLARRLSLIGAPYLVWAVLYAVLYVARAADYRVAAAELPALILTGHVWYHLYFIPMLLTFYLLTPVAAVAVHRSPELFVAATYLLRIVAGPAIVHALGSLDPLAGQYATHVLTHLPHMALGALFALRLQMIPGWARRSWPAAIAAGTVLLGYLSVSGLPSWPLESQRLMYPAGMALTVVGLAVGAIEFEPHLRRWSRLLTHAGSLAFGAYFVHPAYLLSVDAVLARTGTQTLWAHWWFPVAVWLVVAAASFTTAEALRRGRATAWLIGSKPAAR